MEHCIVYFSSWQQNYPLEELAAVLEQSQHTNRQNGITGATLFVRGNVIQVLEGSPETVKALYARIQADERHTNLKTILDRPIPQRLFEDYSMGYETITEQQLAQIQALVPLEDNLDGNASDPNPLILRMIKLFYQSNRYN